MATITRFEEFEVWQLARLLSNRIFQLYTSSPGFAKDYKLKDQINASSGSIMDNIAEGFGRGSKNEFINFLSYSIGSSEEVKSQLYRGLDRNYYDKAVFDEVYEMTDKVRNGTGKLIQYLNTCPFPGIKFRNRINEKPQPTSKKPQNSNDTVIKDPNTNNQTSNDKPQTSNDKPQTTNN